METGLIQFHHTQNTAKTQEKKKEEDADRHEPDALSSQTEWTDKDSTQALSYFSEHGNLYREQMHLFKKEIPPDEAMKRLKQGETVLRRNENGEFEKLSTLKDLQTLDTLEGEGRKPNLTPREVAAIQHLEKGVDSDDGFFITSLGIRENKLDSYQAYKKLTEDKNPEITVHYDQESKLKIHTLKDATELSDWLVAQQERPYTKEQAKAALNYLEKQVGLYQSGVLRKSRITADEAYDRILEGKGVLVPSSVDQDYDEVNSFRNLQEMDTVRGQAPNPIIPKEQAQGLRFLEKGKDKDDGFYQKTTFGEKRLDAYEVVQQLCKDRKPVTVRVGDNLAAVVTSLEDVQKLNALEGDGINTILPDREFTALRYFSVFGAVSVGGKKAGPFAALQALESGEPLDIESKGRCVKAWSTADLHELCALEVDNQNTILPEAQWKLLKFYDKGDSYNVDKNYKARAYEVLQAFQARKSIEVRSEGRWAPVANFEALGDLAAFETNTFPKDGVPQDIMKVLQLFEGAAEGLEHSGFRVDGREGRAYEGWEALKAGKPFDAWSCSTKNWNRVLSRDDLHELDVFYGLASNDILPMEQFHLLQEMGDSNRTAVECLITDATRVGLNGYEALQEFQAGRGVTYKFPGGDFESDLYVPVANSGELATAHKKVRNQKEYDRYRYTVPEFAEKLQNLSKELPELGRENLEKGQSDLSDGKTHQERGEKQKKSGLGDLESGRHELGRAQSHMSSAESMPSMLTETYTDLEMHTSTDCHGHMSTHMMPVIRTRCVPNRRREHEINEAQSEMRRARSHIDDAENKIRRGEKEIRDASKEIQEANGVIKDAQELNELLPEFHNLAEGLNEGNYDTSRERIEAAISRMKRLVHIRSLEENFRKEQKLIANMKERPERPAGWVVPVPRVEE